MLRNRGRTPARLDLRPRGARRRPRFVLLVVLLLAAGALGTYTVADRYWSGGTAPEGLAGEGPQALANRAAAETARRESERAAALAEAKEMAEAGASLQSRLIRTTAESAKPTVALTFDDGPHPEWTPRTLDALRRHDVKAVFCVVGEQAAEHPELLRDIVAEGHQLCNHSYTHDFDLPQLDRSGVEAELERTLKVVRDAVPGVAVPWYRAPGGFWGELVWDVAVDNGMQSLWWAIDPVDWGRPGADALFRRVSDTLHPGAVILLHDGGGDRSGTVQVLDRLIPHVRAQGYEFTMPATAIPDTHELPEASEM